MIPIILVAALSFSPCNSFSFPRSALGGKGFGGGGGEIPGRSGGHFDDGDDHGGDERSGFRLTSLSWLASQCGESKDDEGTSRGEMPPDGSIEGTNASEMSMFISAPAELLRGGGGISTATSKESEKKSIGGSLNDALDSVQAMLIGPFKVAGSALSKSISVNPFKKKEQGQTEESKLKQKQHLLSSTKVRSVSAPDSDLVPPDVITECAKEANLIGGTLTPETLESTARMINRQYLEHGYVMNSVTGATLIPSSDGKENAEGDVELKVREVKLARPRPGSPPPVCIRFVEKVDDGTEDNDSIITLPSESDQSSSNHQRFRTVAGRTRPSKIARMVKLVPGSHFCIFPDRWSRLASFPGSALFGISGSTQRGKSEIFSTIHAIRPVPTSLEGDTVELEIIASENKPYVSLEYGVTKSLYTDQWEGELDLKHGNVFGGGEVATLTARKGRMGMRKKDPQSNNWDEGVMGGPLNWKASIKDDCLGGSDAGYDFEVYRDHVGVGGNEVVKPIDDGDGPPDEIMISKQRGQVNKEGQPLRTGASMKLRLPQMKNPLFVPRVISARFERVDPFGKSDHAQCMASASTDFGTHQQNWEISSRYVRSAISATATAGTKWNAGKSDSSSVNGRSLPYATGTIVSEQILPLNRETGHLPPAHIAVRHAVSASTRHLPRHDAISLGLSSRIRGYKSNHQQSNKSQNSKKRPEENEQNMFHSLKQLLQGGNGDQFQQPIALSKTISGTVEVRIPFERFPMQDKQGSLGRGTFVMFGDWSMAQAQPPFEEEPNLRGLFRNSSIGVGLRKAVQGLPLKVDACITEHGTKGVFFGIGRDFG
ncbi:hypothetical protein ACHAWF_016627 [Thalassiosira exigua]